MLTYVLEETLQLLGRFGFFALHASGPDAGVSRLDLAAAGGAGFVLLMRCLPFSARAALGGMSVRVMALLQLSSGLLFRDR